ncbi:ELL-associated factor 1 [Phoenix dactylifera]|uniref:ELL-associated factor 1 n=1 Tax=Phoenix dactylifera TaxID=42345 RepID=A0A8B7CIE5_PHODC|nr:ELL-associated factor 1 [Phoenix dactylifera]
MASNNGEPSSAPQLDRWYNIRLGSSFKDPSSTKFCTLRYEFKPASIDKSQAGSLHKSKENRVTVEFHNNQPGKPKVTFEGSSEDYKDNDGVLFFDGETFRLERLHRAVKRLRHVRLPGESAAAANMVSAASTGASVESRSPPLGKIAKLQTLSKSVVHSVPVEVERIDIGEPESPGPKPTNKSTSYQSIPPNSSSMSPDPKSYEPEENLDILGDDDRGTPNKTSAGGQTAAIGFDINIPNQNETDDEIADVDVSDEADEGPNAAEALRAQVNAAEEKQQQETSSSSSSSESGSSGSGSGSGSSSSDSEGSDDDSASSGGDIEI